MKTLTKSEQTVNASVPDRAILGLIARLLLHYRGDRLPAEMQQVVAGDWLEDLREFALVDVESACREWRQNNDSRPTPCNIRRLAIAAQRERVPALPKPDPMPEPERPPMSEEERAYIAAGFAELKASLAALPHLAAVCDRVSERVALGYSPLTRELIRQGMREGGQ